MAKHYEIQFRVPPDLNWEPVKLFGLVPLDEAKWLRANRTNAGLGVLYRVVQPRTDKTVIDWNGAYYPHNRLPRDTTEL